MKKWQIAMDEEIATLIKNETWALVPCPTGVQPITFLKCRSLQGAFSDTWAMGFSQKCGFDFGETFIPVAKINAIRCFNCSSS